VLSIPRLVWRPARSWRRSDALPEGDTVHMTAAKLHRALAGQELTGTDFRVPRFATAKRTVAGQKSR
jgi:hypothetical protein